MQGSLNMDYTEGERARDAAMAAVLRAESRAWLDGYYEKAHEIARLGVPFTGEHVRLYCAGIYPEPHDPNVWGAAFSGFVHKGTIKRTGRLVNPVDPKSHACKKSEWIHKGA